jgi:uncharacterized coiled-coil protein SlyX
LLTRCPLAVWRPLPEFQSEPLITPTQLIFHTMVGTLAGTEGYFRDKTSIESHYGLGCKRCPVGAALWQWMNLDRQTDANRTANVRAHSVETCDLHYTTAANYSNPPWDGDQVAKLIALGRWECDNFAIPRRICPTPDSPGLGWHGMWDNTRFELVDGSTPWTPSAGKSCPNPTRRRQLVEIIIPAIIAGHDAEDIMTPAQETKLDTANKALATVATGLAALRADLEVFGTKGLEETVEHFAARQREALTKLDALLADPDTAVLLTDAQLDALAAKLAARVGHLAGTLELRPAPVASAPEVQS